MAVKIELKRSAVPGKIPTTSSLELGELALNTYDGTAFLKQQRGSVQTIVQLATTAGSGSNVATASFAISASFATTSSFALNFNPSATASYALYAESASYSSTASYALNAPATVPNEAARYALTNTYPGLLVYQEDVRLTFLLVDTSNVANANGWMTMLTGGSSVSGSQTISGSLTVLGSITGSLFGTASHAVTASYALNVGSPFSITTGSIVAQVDVDPSSLFLIKSGSTRLLNVNNEGVLMLNQYSSVPTAVTGGLYFDTTGNFYVGL
jgi:hypothetical protein